MVVRYLVAADFRGNVKVTSFEFACLARCFEALPLSRSHDQRYICQQQCAIVACRVIVAGVRLGQARK